MRHMDKVAMLAAGMSVFFLLYSVASVPVTWLMHHNGVEIDYKQKVLFVVGLWTILSLLVAWCWARAKRKPINKENCNDQR